MKMKQEYLQEIEKILQEFQEKTVSETGEWDGSLYTDRLFALFLSMCREVMPPKKDETVGDYRARKREFNHALHKINERLTELEK